MKLTSELARAGIIHLRANDRILRGVIDAAGPFALKLRRDRFQSLVRSIISQQISTSAARSIRIRLEKFLAPEKIAPETLAKFTPLKLREAGISPQKAGYLLDLAQKVSNGQVRLENLARMSDDEVIAELIQVKGIGVWTAQMFLMFCLGRVDVFPHGDLGIRSALKNLYELDELPDEEMSHEIAQSWRPYATIASWYCWRSLDLPQFAKKRVAPPQ